MINRKPLARDYIRWMCDTIDERVYIDYPEVLFEVAFEMGCWFYVPNDDNRMSEIKRMREAYALKKECHYEDFVDELHPGTMLELLVVLAHQCAFMSECPELDAKFWWDEMMNNTGIRWMDGWMGGAGVNGIDRYQLYRALNRVLTRDYDKHGYAYDGDNHNIFICPNTDEPMYHIELWRQMCLYVTDKCKYFAESVTYEMAER